MNQTIEISPNQIKLFLLRALLVLFLATAPINGNTAATVHVRTAEVSESSLDSPAVNYSAILRAADRARLAFTDGGRLVSRPVEIGTQVKAGQVLARLDEKPYANAVKAAQASFKEAQTRLHQRERDQIRVKKLEKAEAATIEELEHVSLGLDAIRARCEATAVALKEARRRQHDAVLRSPYDGIITKIFAEPGEVVAAGSPIAALSRNLSFEVEIEVPETTLADLAIGDRFCVNLPSWKIFDLTGTITSLGRGTSRHGGLFPVIVTLEKAPLTLMPGLSAEVILPGKKGEALMVPLSAVINPGGRQARIFLVKNNRARLIKVKTGNLCSDLIAVLGPLAAGDRVIIAGQTNLLDGDSVEIEP